MKLKLCHLYPDLLNLYGDRGNIICITKRLEWRGIETELVQMPVGKSGSLADFDMVFVGGGQDFEQAVLLEDLHSGKSREIKAAVEDGVTFLAICGGYQMLGEYYQTQSGEKYPFSGAVDLITIGAKKRMIGNYKFKCNESEAGVVVGFENHSGKTYLGSGVKPLGTVLAGYGNNGDDGTEGVHYKNTFGTYSHGPVLPKNPQFCDYLIRTALERRYGTVSLDPLEDKAETLAHNEMDSII